MEAPPTPQELKAREGWLRHLGRLAHLLDDVFRVPGTGWRFGLDPVIGLIPGAGDLIGMVLGAYSVIVARQLGAPASVLGRMLLNLTVDAAVGAIPLLGDLFDFAFKAHVRNRVLLEKWLERPGPTRRASFGVLMLVLLALLAIGVVSVWLAIDVAVRLIRMLQG